MILLLIMFFSSPLFAETNYVAGAATYHLLGTNSVAASKFRNKWSDDGRLIGTPILAIETIHEADNHWNYYTEKYFIGQNSVGGSMAGYVESEGIHSGSWYRGVLLGVYAQDASKFYKVNIVPPGLPIGQSLSICPIFGGEVMYDFKIFKWHLAITPFLMLTYISISGA